MSGKLYGIGLGPGDPELVTRKAYRLIQSCPVIAYPVLERGDSFARAIAKDMIPQGTEEIAISVPMTVDRAPAQAAYDKGAEKLRHVLDAGKDVGVLCEGDPFFYGSFMYLFSRLSDDYETQIIPGITSVVASSAAIKQPLAARTDVHSVIPGTLSSQDLLERLSGVQSAAIIKVGRHLPKIKGVLNELGLIDNATYISHATLPNQQIWALKDAPEGAPYFSIILINKGQDPWL